MVCHFGFQILDVNFDAFKSVDAGFQTSIAITIVIIIVIIIVRINVDKFALGGLGLGFGCWLSLGSNLDFVLLDFGCGSNLGFGCGKFALELLDLGLSLGSSASSTSTASASLRGVVWVIRVMLPEAYLSLAWLWTTTGTMTPGTQLSPGPVVPIFVVDCGARLAEPRLRTVVGDNLLEAVFAFRTFSAISHSKCE